MEGLTVTRFPPAANDDVAPANVIRLAATPFLWRDSSLIPPRDFLFGSHFIRQFVSGTAAPGGTGKSFLIQAEALSMVSGVSFLGINSDYANLRVWYWNLEDPADEIERRFAAAAQHHAIAPEACGDRLFVNSGRDTPLVLATKVREQLVIAEPVVSDLITEIRAKHIDVIIIDPFISSHAVPENDNSAIDAVVKLWGRVAGEGNCAVELVHHTKKMGGESMSDESFRGAKSLVDGLRSARVLHPMTEKDSVNLAVGDERRRFFYVMAEKQNLAPPADKRDWFRLESVNLANGDNVASVEPWQAPNPFDDVSATHLEAVRLRFRTENHKQSDQAQEWGGYVVAEILGLDVGSPQRSALRTMQQKGNRAKVKRILQTWEANGTIGVEMRNDPKRREDKPYYYVPKK